MTAKQPESEKLSPREPRLVTGIYLKRTGSTIILREGNTEQVYPADYSLLLYLAKPDTKVHFGDSVTVQLLDADGVYVAKNIGPDPMPGTFKTAKEILQENIDAARKEKESMAEEVARKEREEGERKMRENDEYARKLAAERQNVQKGSTEAQKPLPTSEPTQTPDKVPANNDTPVSPPIVEEDGIARIVRLTKERNATEHSSQLPAVVANVTTPLTFNPDQVNLIKAMVARNATDTEFQLLMYLAAQYHLDPLRKQIWMTKYGDSPASIFTGRDGFLEIAHRSGQFDGMESGTRTEKVGDKEELIGWCRVWRKDMTHPFYVEIFASEYDTGKALWKTKRRVMTQKVAESSCLRRAFSVSGLYSPEEMPEQSGGG